MKNKHIKKFLYIVCSLFLVFSMCVPNFNLNVSADEPQNTQSQEISETENNSDVPATETNTPESNKEVPDQISVQTLEQTQSDDSTDRVEYVDEKGRIIEGAPTTIKLGKISDHTEITIPDKKYEFKNAKVSDEDCVFIGQYENYIYYSTDGNIAKKLTDKQLLVMTYSESKNSVNEEIEQVATEDTNKSEESTEQIIDNEGETEQSEELNVPESISVQSLDEALQISVANGDENATSTDRVEYVDVNGKPIVGAPSVIGVGAIADHKELAIEGRHFEFKSAKVDGKNCVYIGKYNDTIYYSTDGVIAIKLDDTQKLTMMYQEYHLVSIKEVVPDSCTPGTITQKNGSLDTPLDISNQIRVNAEENFIISVTPGTDTAKTNDPRAKRFIIESVVSQDGATITKENGNENKATYSINFVKDDTITITYKEQSVYRIFINTKDINGEEYINIAHSVENGWQYLKDQDKIMWTFTPDDVSEMSGYNLDIPAFHTNRGYRVIHMVVNGTSIQASSESGVSEVPISKGDSVSSDPGKLSLITKMTDSYTTTRGDEKNCSYEYKMDLKVRTGKFEDYNFTLVPYKEERGKQAVTVRLYTNQTRSGEGLDVVMWDYEKQELVPVQDNETIDMDPVKYNGTTTRQVRIFFAKPKAGYEFVNGLQSAVGVMYGQPHGDNPVGDGKKNDANAGTIDAMTATSLIRGDNSFKIYDD